MRTPRPLALSRIFGLAILSVEMRRFLMALVLGAGCLASAADRYLVDWKQVDAELLEHFTALLKIDTSNPPGNETKAVNYLRPILEKEGIEVQVFALDPDRANMVARLRGNGSKKPIAVFGH